MCATRKLVLCMLTRRNKNQVTDPVALATGLKKPTVTSLSLEIKATFAKNI